MQQAASTLAPVAPAPDRLWSADEFMALPLNLKLYELVRGVLVEVPMTGYEHGEIETNIIFALQQHVRPRRLGQITPWSGTLIRSASPTLRSCERTGSHRARSGAPIARSSPTSP